MKQIILIMCLCFMVGCTAAIRPTNGISQQQAQRQIFECEQAAFNMAAPHEKGNPFIIDIYSSK